MLNGTTYQTPDFYCTKLDGVLYKFATPRCAHSWKQRVVPHRRIDKPAKSLGFRAGSLLQDFKSGSIWYIDGAVRRQVDYDAWLKHAFDWDDVILVSRKEIQLHEAKGDLE